MTSNRLKMAADMEGGRQVTSFTKTIVSEGEANISKRSGIHAGSTAKGLHKSCSPYRILCFSDVQGESSKAGKPVPVFCKHR